MGLSVDRHLILDIRSIWTHSDKETGFFTKFTVRNEVYRKKTRFLGPMLDYSHQEKSDWLMTKD
jgi:hypothetical protein